MYTSYIHYLYPFCFAYSLNLHIEANIKNIINDAISNGTRGAAAALVAFQTGEEIDLDKKGLFGFDYYNDAFNEAYTET